ncbi:MAG: PqiC family protein [Deltaproteobacteria bacterium]|jgi:uncharacterized protein|nr:PqiC family protein [Deltaproteobacteria bacterium]
MKAMAFYRFCWVGALVGTMLCAGCFGKSQPSRFYTLSAMEQAAAGALPVSPARDVAIGIGPIKIADYLDRSEIVTRTGDNRLELAEYDQWAGSFEDNLTQVMADNIGVMVPTERIYLYPWPTSLTLDYQVVLDIVRCDGRLNGEVLLTARWRVLAGAKKKVLAVRRSTITEPVNRPGYEALVAAQSRALATLSREIVLAIRAASRESSLSKEDG